ncbi:MAG: VOC family protein [Candidatus Binatia bacterium]|nr:VOC family protein [Candidatus Binatia bacterium]MDG2010700.1 VOC family protein [Candidatus Binatia bacterium]
MTNKEQMSQVNPYFLVDDVPASAAYYRDVLGFHFDRFWGDPSSFVMVRRDQIQIMLRQRESSAEPIARPNKARLSGSFDAYVYVRDVDELHKEFKERGANILYEPCDQPHQCREFEVEDPNGYVLCFGQDLLTS